MFRHRSQSSVSRRPPAVLLAAALTAALIGSGLVVSFAVSPPAAGLAQRPDVGGRLVAKDAPVELPSEGYLEAMAHQYDRLSFEPGGLVTVPFRPKAGDAWEVDGQQPQALPAGRLSGAQMLAGMTGGDADSGIVSRPAPAQAGPGLNAARPEAPGAAIAPNALAGSLKRDVIGFLPYWKLGSNATVLDYNALSTVAYFGVAADSNGNLIKTDSDGSVSDGWYGWTSSALTNVINAAHGKGTRVVFTLQVFAWTTAQANIQSALLGNATARANLARQTAAAIRDRGADGVNLDFEPIVSGYGDDFTAFVQTLRAELNKIKAGYELTIDVGGYTGNFELEKLVAPGMADALFIMGYDFRGASSSPVGSIAPLSSSRIYDLTDSVNAYLARVPASKLILGLPWYGRAWSTGTSSALNAPNMSGATYGGSVTATYATAKELADTNGHLYDTTENSAWTAYKGAAGVYGTSATWRELYYDDARSLAAKYDMINAKKLRGTGIWCLGNDGYMSGSTVVRYPDLWKPIYDKFVNDLTPPTAGVRTIAPVQSQEAFSVTWTGDDDLSGVARYDVQYSADGGAWTTWLSGTTATGGTFVGTSHHGYSFRVRATDRSNNVGGWNVANAYVAAPSLGAGGFGAVQTDGLNLRKGPGVAYGATHTFNTGELVSIVGGPQSADGYTWYQVVGPLTEWGVVGDDTQSGWVAASGAGSWVKAAHAPNTTYVDSALTGYSIGGTASTAAGPRTVLPIVGATPSQPRFTWNVVAATDSVTLNVYRRDNTLRGSISLGAQGTGVHSFTWDGRLAGATVGAGNYLVQVAVSSGGKTYYAPSAAPFTDAVWASFGIQLRSNGRWSGADRYATSAASSAATFAPGVPVVFIATGEKFPDALTAAAVAGKQGGPVLLVTASYIPAATATELQRLKPASIVVVGGTVSVSDGVLASLRNYTKGTVTRWPGADRYASAAEISRRVFTSTPVPIAFVATGENFPDALAGSAAAARLGGPVLLTPSTYLATATATELARLHPARIVILGGEKSVYPSVATQLAKYTTGTVERWADVDRVSTAAKISSKAFPANVPVVFVVTAWNYPDATSAASSAGKLLGPVLLVDPKVGITDAVADELTRLRPARIVVVGGPASTPDSVLNALAAYAVGT